MNPKPRIGLLGIMQALYDDMIPGIAERQDRYAHDIAEQLADIADWTVGRPVKDRRDAEAVMREFVNADLDGVMVVMLTYGPAMRVARLFNENRLPVLLANIQPEPTVTPAWDMADMTYNQGIHGAQDTANAMVRADRPFTVLTDDWRTPEFAVRVDRWARAARAVTAWRSLKVGVFGYAMNDMGDIRVDENALLRALGPEISFVAPGDLYRGSQAVTDDDVAALMAWEDREFAIDPALTGAEREDHARMQIAIERILTDRGYGAYSTHFDAIGEDGRFQRLPLAAASSLMAKGYGYGAEGDAMAAAMVYAGHQLIGDGHFTEMYAMDFPSDSILMSHMGEGNWRIARTDEPVRLIRRELGIGKLDEPPTFLFRYRPGPATLACLVSLGGEKFRLVVAEGTVLDSQELPALEMPYGQFRPTSGVRACMDGWLTAGGPHHQVMNIGHHAADWQVFCQLAGIEFVQV
ncbi:L-fucose/L-arabinose isomerase family protein [Nocardia pseudovaccinii]|uniref:L-fucose/L-arabinose isomerase family protein n=1 Tax=Nocardia pseudovaccinii TaxID=189540 RepID=UPI0007A51B48|nr:L-fucose/L-arabinose isomerase family protein [Nocardia pseudovaccinii]